MIGIIGVQLTHISHVFTFFMFELDVERAAPVTGIKRLGRSIGLEDKASTTHVRNSSHTRHEWISCCTMHNNNKNAHLPVGDLEVEGTGRGEGLTLSSRFLRSIFKLTLPCFRPW